MSTLKKPEALDASLLAQVAVKICAFANGTCDCQNKGRRLCGRSEEEAARVIRMVRNSTEGEA